MSFSARDLNSFTGMASQNSENTYKKTPIEPKNFVMTKQEHKKTFYEEIYDQQV
jgi:hypothetical protein